MAHATAPTPVRVRLWDRPVRLVHWSFVLLLPALWWTWRSGEMALHQTLGHIALALVAFRLFWGFAGGSTARFAGFVRGPRGVIAYLAAMHRKEAEPVVGHNPLGGWSVLALMALLATQVSLGLFAQDVDGEVSGPLARHVSYETADAARVAHGTVFYVLLGFVALHVAAILFHLLVKRDDLVRPMIVGHKAMAAAPAAPPRFVPAWRVALGAALSGGLAWWVSLGCPL